MRGNLARSAHCPAYSGSIPAYAGEPVYANLYEPDGEVYPRVCGGTCCACAIRSSAGGLSPRMRGNQIEQGPARWRLGSIPAYAGEPISVSDGQRLHGVYPRVCGGTTTLSQTLTTRWGLSPRMRGNRVCQKRTRVSPGSIPAYAGEPEVVDDVFLLRQVYPRVCGGTTTPIIGIRISYGLSPRMRGNPGPAGCSKPAGRSIPAYAGEPPRQTRRAAISAVYPRVCGGTRLAQAKERTAEGLSPRMRGNPSSADCGPAILRSIPAYAGEPMNARRARGQCQVYPRVCGGTAKCARSHAVCQGLSPRMRGNPPAQALPLLAHGSIPAYAGEPRPASGGGGSGRVYPRVCGGTEHRIRHCRHRYGLSPRMRGNRRRVPGRALSMRSIPAYAGEPAFILPTVRCTEVYPRVCGGTVTAATSTGSGVGLSPRMRGNLRRRYVVQRIRGSIPAYAGEPPGGLVSSRQGKVYPRVCGGTTAGRTGGAGNGGLSPRMRGNQPPAHNHIGTEGSIPAYAGEPSQSQSNMALTMVYPRVCGGTS